MTIERFRLPLFFLALGLALLACNLPTQAEPTEIAPPDAVFTEVAATIAAQLPMETPAPPAGATEIPPAAATASLTPTPTPTQAPATPSPTTSPTATDIPQVIFFDDLVTNQTWYTYEDTRYGFTYTNEGYQVYNNIPYGLIWSIREQSFSAVGLEVSGTRISGPADSYFGVVCYHANDGDDYYALVIGDDGFYGLGLMENEEFEFLKTGMDNTGAIQQGMGQTNRIRGICNGGHFLIYANGELLLDTWDDTLTSGIVGLVTGNKQNSGSTFRFNDFAITYP